MRLIAYFPSGRKDAHIGVLAGNAVAPLASLADFYADVDGNLHRARSATDFTLELAQLKLAPPIPPGAKMICAAINYKAHGAEANLKAPPYPNLFARWTSTLVTDGTAIRVPASETGGEGRMGMDWEVELGVIIGRRAREVGKADAGQAVLGYVVFNDVTARQAQLEAFKQPNGQWCLGKNPDDSGPIGSVIVTPDEVDAGNLKLVTRVNGETMQDGNTSQMIFDIPTLIEFCARTITLQPGDFIATGTPEGVGVARKPPRFLKPGDLLECEVEGVGALRNPITG